MRELSGGGWIGGKRCAACLCFVPRDYLVCSIAFVVFTGGKFTCFHDADLIPAACVPSAKRTCTSHAFHSSSLSPSHFTFVFTFAISLSFAVSEGSTCVLAAETTREISVALRFAWETRLRSLARLVQVISRLVDSRCDR